MRNRLSLILYFLFIALFPECVSGKVATGAERFEQYLPFIRGKRVGMVVNHTSVVGTEQTHYGNNKTPTAAQRKDIDVILFDIQDV